MTFRQDYGGYLRGQGNSEGMLYTFESVAIDHVSVIDGILFSTLVDGVLDGVQQSASFNFGADVFGQLVALAPKAVQARVHARLKAITRLPRTIEFPSPVLCRIEAMLGERQVGRADEVIPLVVSRIGTPARAPSETAA
jgi:hypothetical protein